MPPGRRSPDVGAVPSGPSTSIRSPSTSTRWCRSRSGGSAGLDSRTAGIELASRRHDDDDRCTALPTVGRSERIGPTPTTPHARSPHGWVVRADVRPGCSWHRLIGPLHGERPLPSRFPGVSLPNRSESRYCRLRRGNDAAFYVLGWSSADKNGRFRTERRTSDSWSGTAQVARRSR